MEIIDKGMPFCAFREDKGSGGEGVELHTTGGLILYFCLLVAPYISGPAACSGFDLRISSLVYKANGSSKGFLQVLGPNCLTSKGVQNCVAASCSHFLTVLQGGNLQPFCFFWVN